MKRLVLVILALAPLALHGQFDRWFEDKTLRMDFYHCGGAQAEEYHFSGLRCEPFWAGSNVSLVDGRDYGVQRFEVRNGATGELIYSRGYCTLWNEWQTTAEASAATGCMPESIVFPFPKAAVRVEIFRRVPGGEWISGFSRTIDPARDRITEYVPRYEAFDVEVHGTPENRVDIVLLPEGYTAAERGEFEEACREWAEGLFSFEPYAGLRERFNIRAVWVPSAESGVTDPGTGLWKDTPARASFGTFGIDRYLMVEDFNRLRDPAAAVPYEFIYVLANTDKYGGGGVYNFYAISAAGGARSKTKVYIHEFGHLFAGLGDEYVGNVSYGDMYPAGVEPWEENLTTLTRFESKFWSRMVPEGTPVPTPLAYDNGGRPGVYEGGGYVSEGVYRPWPNCLMNNLHAIDRFCPVCDRAIRDQIEFVCK